MKKFLLVVFIGMVLAIDLYGIVNDIRMYIDSINEETNNGINEEVATVVYEE